MNKIIYITANAIQTIIIISLFILEVLSRKKAGVNHHLLARKYQLQEGFFNHFNIMQFSLIIFIILLVVLLISTKQKKITLIKFELMKLIIAGTFFIFASNFEPIIALNSYIYIMSGVMIVFIIQFFITLLGYFKLR